MMKTKFFLISLILGAVLMTSCYNDPSEKELKAYLAAMRQYYPYPDGGTFVYVNESQDRTWEVKPGLDKDRYPYTNIHLCHREPFSKCSGDGSVSISVPLMKDNQPHDKRVGDLCTFIQYTGHVDYESSTEIFWIYDFSISENERLKAEAYVQCNPKEVLPYFTDTIILTQQGGPEGAYARIVKGKGLTDFSADGETVWRRVK